MGTSDSDFELCILLREEEKFYHVLLVEIRHLIRLTAISREIKSCLLDNDNLRDICKVYVILSKVIRKKYQVVIAAGSHLFPFRTASFYESLEEKSSRLFFLLGDG